MDINHHPDPSTLMTCAAGSQPEALCAVVSSHLAMCGACMQEVARMELIGTALLDQIDPEPLAGGGLQASGSEAPSSDRLTSLGDTFDDVPAPLREVVGADIDALDWHFRGPGVWSHPIPMSPHAQGELILVKLAPGSELPERAYEGEELLLVLRGSCMRDGTLLSRGDYAEFFDQTAHSVGASKETGCTLLIAYERLPHQKGRVGRKMIV